MLSKSSNYYICSQGQLPPQLKGLLLMNEQGRRLESELQTSLCRFWVMDVNSEELSMKVLRMEAFSRESRQTCRGDKN